MSSEEKRIREFAYQIWETEGKPEGQEARHWEMAHKLVQAEALAPNPSPEATGNKTARVKTTGSKASQTKAKAKPGTSTPLAAPLGEKPLAVKKPRAPRKPPAS